MSRGGARLDRNYLMTGSGAFGLFWGWMDGCGVGKKRKLGGLCDIRSR